MPLTNCWGGGFHRNWMVVEFTASAWTFCGGAVGTAPHQPGGEWNRSDCMQRKEMGEKRKTFSRQSGFKGNTSSAKRDRWFICQILWCDFKSKCMMGLFLFFVGDPLEKRRRKRKKGFLWPFFHRWALARPEKEREGTPRCHVTVSVLIIQRP